MSRIGRLIDRWSEHGDGRVLRWKVQADSPGYCDWADRRANLRDPADRPPPVPAQLAADVSRGAPEALAKLGLLAHDVAGEEPLPQAA
eukprot:11957950-Alexandrium_andersonii.AAC.1